ncbi:MAG: metallophosphoesterase family protein [Bryobacterales bacterium]|nr:metallophosphoesterase family protein [Bryobacterales bacterium]
MRRLIISDIHANLEALQAVVRDAEGQYDSVVCLGDVVGYGADPNGVCEWVRENAAAIIRGNHDKACCGLEEPVLFNPVARFAVEWTYEELSDDNRKWLRELPVGPADLGDCVIAHGSVLDEDEYLIDAQDAAGQFPHVLGRLVFFGHTHVQGGFFLRTSEDGEGGEAPGEPDKHGVRLRPGDTALVNPGSVGQPRDLAWESGYALYDSVTREVIYRRCPYDVAACQKKILEAGLPPALAERLSIGR